MASSPPPSKNPSNPNPPWEAILLVAQLLDPKILAVACCVSKSWNAAMSSDHLWKPHCLTHYPSSLHLTNSSLSPCRLFSLLRSSKRRHRHPFKPRISLHHLIFAIDIFRNGTPLLSIAKPGEELIKEDHHGWVFRFDIDVEDEVAATVDGGEELRVVWMVVMKELGGGGAFSMMDGMGKGRLIGGNELWFSEELPGPACCSVAAAVSIGSGGGNFVAELGLVLCEDGGRRRVGRLSLGLMNVVEWRYVGLDDGLLYLQPYLLPSRI